MSKSGCFSTISISLGHFPSPLLRAIVTYKTGGGWLAVTFFIHLLFAGTVEFQFSCFTAILFHYTASKLTSVPVLLVIFSELVYLIGV